jgi:small subunit ribosomal protein S8
MSMQDPIADMLVRIKNAQAMFKPEVTMGASRTKTAIATVLKDEGYIKDFSTEEIDGKAQLQITLKYHQGKGVIWELKRISRPGLRIYKTCKELPRVMGGLGIAILSTPKGVMSDHLARKLGVGGEVLVQVK